MECCERKIPSRSAGGPYLCSFTKITASVYLYRVSNRLSCHLFNSAARTSLVSEWRGDLVGYNSEDDRRTGYVRSDNCDTDRKLQRQRLSSRLAVEGIEYRWSRLCEELQVVIDSDNTRHGRGGRHVQ